MANRINVKLILELKSCSMSQNEIADQGICHAVLLAL